MKKLITTILALALALGAMATTPDYSKLVLNEIDGEDLFVEIFNSGTVDIPMEGVRLQRNGGPTGGTEWVGTATDVIPAGAYRIILFRSGNFPGDTDAPSPLQQNPAFTGWTVTGGLSNQQTLKIELVCPDGKSIDAFIRGDGHQQLPTWGTSGASRPNAPRPSYSRMVNGSWAYAVSTPGAANGPRVSDIVSPGYLRSELVLTEVHGDSIYVEIFNAGRTEISMEGIRIQRNGGPTTGGTEWVGTATDVIPANTYRLILFRTGNFPGDGDAPSPLQQNPAFDGWTITGGLSNQQILKVAIVNAHGNEVSRFIRGDEPLPNWGNSTGVTRPDAIGGVRPGYSRMNDGTWAYAVGTPGAPNGTETGPIVNPGYIVYFALPTGCTKLTISDVAHLPTIPTQDDDVVVSATVTENGSDVKTVVLEWAHNGTDQTPLPMTKGGSDVWTATIPKQAVDAVVTYTVVATNELDEVTESNVGTYTVIGADGFVVPGDADPLAGNLLILHAWGGTTMATHHFVELYNNTDVPIDLEGITLFSTRGYRNQPNDFDHAWRSLPLTGTIPAKGSFLILRPDNASATFLQFENDEADILATADELFLSNQSFKIALIRTTGVLDVQCPFTMDGDGIAQGYIDMVGAINDVNDRIHGFEGAPTRNSNSEGVRRKSLIDTDDNNYDFIAARFASGEGQLTPEQAAQQRPRNSSDGAWDPFPGGDVSIAVILNNTNINIFPNPIENELTITVDGSTQGMTYQIFDLNGRLLQTERLNSETTTVNVQGLRAGTYVLNINQDGQQIRSFRIVKQ